MTTIPDAVPALTGVEVTRERCHEVKPGRTFRHYKGPTYTVVCRAVMRLPPLPRGPRDPDVCTFLLAYGHDDRSVFEVWGAPAIIGVWRLLPHEWRPGELEALERLVNVEHVVYASHAKETLNLRPLGEFVANVQLADGSVVPRFRWPARDAGL